MAVSLIGLGIGAGTAIYGAIKQHQAEKAAQNNKRPVYNIPQEEYDAQRLAEYQASQGMGDEARQYLQNQQDRGFASGAGTIMKAGGDANAIGSLYDKFSQGTQGIALYDDQQRLRNLQGLMDQYHRMSANRDKQWQVNQYGPYADRAQAIAQQLAGASNLTTSGINMAGQGLMGLAAKRPDTNIDISQNTTAGSNANYGSGGMANFNVPQQVPGGPESMPNSIDVNAPAGRIYDAAWQPDNSYFASASAPARIMPSDQNVGAGALMASQNPAYGPLAPGGNTFNWNGYYPTQQ